MVVKGAQLCDAYYYSLFLVAKSAKILEELKCDMSNDINVISRINLM